MSVSRLITSNLVSSRLLGDIRHFVSKHNITRLTSNEKNKTNNTIGIRNKNLKKVGSNTTNYLTKTTKCKYKKLK